MKIYNGHMKIPFRGELQFNDYTSHEVIVVLLKVIKAKGTLETVDIDSKNKNNITVVEYNIENIVAHK